MLMLTATAVGSAAFSAGAQPAAAKPVGATFRAARPRTFTPETAPRWIVAAATPTAVPPKPQPAPPKGWRPDRRWALAPTLGTDGVGGELSFLATRSLVLRARGNWLGVRQGKTFDNVHYSGRLKYATGGVFLDLHPLPGIAHPLFIGAGVIKGERRVSILATPQGSISYGGHSYTAAQLGTVSGEIRPSTTAPFIGAGFDNTYDTEGSFGFRLLAGVAASSRPSVTLRSSGGLLSASPILNADLAAEEAKIKGAADYLRYYPVVSTGIAYKF